MTIQKTAAGETGKDNQSVQINLKDLTEKQGSSDWGNSALSILFIFKVTN